MRSASPLVSSLGFFVQHQGLRTGDQGGFSGEPEAGGWGRAPGHGLVQRYYLVQRSLRGFERTCRKGGRRRPEGATRRIHCKNAPGLLIDPFCVKIVVVFRIQRIGCHPGKTTSHGGRSRSWSAQERMENKKRKSGGVPPPPPEYCILVC